MSEKQDIPSLLPGATPIFKRGNGVGCLCLHGLTASPAEQSWLGEHLANQGYTVYLPRLAGHGADYRDLQHLTWRDWYLSAVDGYHVLSAQCEQVFVTGLSMGGLLSLLLAASYPIDGLVVMGTPILPVTNRPHWIINLVKHLQPYQYFPDKSEFPRRLRQAQIERGERNLGRVRYDLWATQSIVELNNLIEIVHHHSHQITSPTCLIYSKLDKTVPYSHMQQLMGLLAQTSVETHTLEHSGHIMTQDTEQEAVFGLVTDFIQRHTK